VNPLTRAAGTVAAAIVIAGTALLGTRYLAAGVGALVVVAALGWPRLLRVYRRRVSTVIICAAGALSVVAIGAGRGEPYLRYAVAAAAAAVLLALSAEVFFPSPPGRAITSVTGMMTGAMVAVSSGAWVAAARTPGADDLVVAGAACLAFAGVGAIVSVNPQINALCGAVAGVGAGVGMGFVFDSIGWASGILVGAAAAAAVLLVAELGEREPTPRSTMAAIAAGVTPILASGVLVYLGGRLLVG